jgi:hypothetical protein
MPTAETRIATDRADRYLVQLCRHAAAMAGRGGHRGSDPSGGHSGGQGGGHGAAEDGGHVTVDAQWTDTHGVITFAPHGSCTVDAGESELVVRIEAVDGDKLARIQQIIGSDLDRFGRRDGLTVSWSTAEDSGVA